MATITMTTGWLLLLLLLVVSSHSVDSQRTPWTGDDETCSAGGLLRNLRSEIEKMLANQQTIVDRLGKS